MGWRGCLRRFTLLSEGGVRISWACGATQVVLDELAVDVDYLADHLPERHHHHHRPTSRGGTFYESDDL